MRAVAIGTAHLSFQNGVMIRKPELYFFIQMALKTSGGIFSGIDNIGFAAAGVDVDASGTVAHLAPLNLLPGDTDSGMGGKQEFFLLFLVAGDAGI